MNQSSNSSSQPTLKRIVGLPGAIALGLGSMIGTGIYVSLGLGAYHAQYLTPIAVILAGLLALCNALSSAQLAAAHPIAGGTYQYARIYLHPFLGLLAGILFLTAKSASASAASLAFANNFIRLINHYTTLNLPSITPTILGLLAIIALTIVILTGLRRSNQFNITLILLVLASLLTFIIACMIYLADSPTSPPQSALAQEPLKNSYQSLFPAAALIFVAYTGYGRIATMGEEITQPKRNIPLAVIFTVLLTAILYTTIAYLALKIATPDDFYKAAVSGTALEQISSQLPKPNLLITIIALGAILATLTVLLNLILGLSRVVFAMARNHHLPQPFSLLNQQHNPTFAIILVAIIILLLTTLGSIKTAWSLSALTVLIYYGLTNLSALQLPKQHRLYPRIFSILGLLGCFTLSFFIEPIYWLVFLAIFILTTFWHLLTKAHLQRPDQT
ncbi:amino acid permease [Planctomycetota bacterium]|nr:amino acid permease [Planctomycetota bacterium]